MDTRSRRIHEKVPGVVKRGEGLFLGNAGEHYVVAELLRRGIITDLAPRNAPGIDVLATTGPRSVNVRVKTRSDEAKDWVWVAGKTDGVIFKRLHGERDFTVLVHLSTNATPPRYWIVPTQQLDEELRKDFAGWVARPGKSPNKPHDPTNRMRRFGHASDQVEWLSQFENRWDLILAALTVESLRKA